MRKLVRTHSEASKKSTWPSPLLFLQAWSKYAGSTCSLPPFAAEWCLSAPTLPPTISTPVSTDALVCCLSATVSPQEVGAAIDPAEKLPPTLAEAGATSGMCLRALSALASVCRRFKRALAQAGVRAHILACLLLLCAYRLCAGCSGQLRSCRQRWLRRERRAVCVCVRCLR